MDHVEASVEEARADLGTAGYGRCQQRGARVCGPLCAHGAQQGEVPTSRCQQQEVHLPRRRRPDQSGPKGTQGSDAEYPTCRKRHHSRTDRLDCLSPREAPAYLQETTRRAGVRVWNQGARYVETPNI